MQPIATYVFFDLETTGLPFQERNRTKIIELSFVAALRKDIEKSRYGETPPVSKLTFVFNPQRTMHREVTELTGLSNDLLQHAPLFGNKIKTLVTFLEEQPKPVCLVAHNGNSFDFKILLAEFNDAGMSLPIDLLCVDSLIGFRKLLKDTTIDYKSLESQSLVSLLQDNDNLLTDDEDEWPDLSVSFEEWQEIDDLCTSLSDMSSEDFAEEDNKKKSKTKPKVNKENLKNRKTEAIKRVMNKKPVCKKENYKLSALYKRLLNREEENAHRAEADCFMLLHCVVALKNQFLPWADTACRMLTEIKPLERH